LRRYYPLPREYDYAETDEGGFVVRQWSDGAQSSLLVEEELLGFDVPAEDPKRRADVFRYFHFPRVMSKWLLTN
jgi:hypothetical protein